MLLSFEICRNRSLRFAYYRFVSITKDFVKVFALCFFVYFSSWVESFKIFDEQQDL